MLLISISSVLAILWKGVFLNLIGEISPKGPKGEKF
jgi:hypothetical protein